MANKNKTNTRWKQQNGEWVDMPRSTFEKIVKSYKGNNLNDNDIKYLYSRLGETKFSPADITYLIATESGFNTKARNSKGTASGLVQITDDRADTIFGKNSKEIKEQYKTKSRNNRDAIDDAFVQIHHIDKNITSREDHRRYGRLKVNNLIPNAGFKHKLNKYEYLRDSFTKNQWEDIEKEFDTWDFENLATYYDNEYKGWREQYGLPKMALGGLSWDSGVTSDSISHEDVDSDDWSKWVDAGGGTLSGAGTGAMIGSFLGPVGTLVGAGVGALIGGGLSWWKGRKAETEEEASRRTALVAQARMNDQQIASNMTSKYQQDILRLKQQEDNNIGVAKFGGLIGRRRMATGGNIVPNSSNTQVAYGRTHEQIDPMTGETGIAYNDRIEVEGGGYVNGKEYAGEVIRETPQGAQVFSDTLRVPKTHATYAQMAKLMSDEKGKLEQEVVSLDKIITAKLKDLPKSKRNKLQTGTEVRNIEKLGYKMNVLTGKAAELEQKTSDLFMMQEQHAGMLGLRPSMTTMRFGGTPRIKAKGGWWDNPNNLGLVVNMGTSLGSAAMSYGAYRNTMDRIAWEANQELPKQSKLQTVLFDPTEDINPELQDLQQSFRQQVKYIQDNTKDPQIAQNRIAQLYINALGVKNKLYQGKRNAEKQTRQTNLTNLINTLNQNNQIAYANAMAEYNKMTGLNMARNSADMQLWQNLGQALGSVNQSIYSYNYGKMVEQGWDRGKVNQTIHFAPLQPVNTYTQLPSYTPSLYPNYNKPLYSFNPPALRPYKFGGMVIKRK